MHLDHDRMFVQPLSSIIQQSWTLSTVQYLANRDVSQVIWFQKMTNQVPLP